MLYHGIDQNAWQLAISLRDENGDVERLICARGADRRMALRSGFLVDTG
jgi:hypothetical protein